ncbi:MAG: phage gp6-like head-tail connector protein, partial [Clostridia bacterium]|nr:phage gp6-like head-tail connector protein [Clostridia bacterium]
MEPSLALLKKQVRADDFSQDDAYLEHLLGTAKETVITATNGTEAELREMDSEGHLPKMLLQAAL